MEPSDRRRDDREREVAEPRGDATEAVSQTLAAVVRPWTSTRSLTFSIRSAAEEADAADDVLDDPAFASWPKL